MAANGLMKWTSVQESTTVTITTKMTVRADACVAMRRRSGSGRLPGCSGADSASPSASGACSVSSLKRRVMRLRKAANGALSFTRKACSPSMNFVPKKRRSRNCSKWNDRTAARMPKKSGLTKIAASRNRTRITKTGMNPCAGAMNVSAFGRRRKPSVEAAVAACSSERASVLSCSVSMRAYPATIDLPEPSVTSPQTNAWMPADSAAPMAVFTASGRTNQTMPTPMLNTR